MASLQRFRGSETKNYPIICPKMYGVVYSWDFRHDQNKPKSISLRYLIRFKVKPTGLELDLELK